MTEQSTNKKERLPGGDTTVTPSSDEAITAEIGRLSREIQGLPTPEVIIEGEQLPPRAVNQGTEPVSTDNTITDEKIHIGRKLTSMHSRLGLLLLRKRLGKKGSLFSFLK